MFGSASQGGKQTDQPDRLPVECCRIFTRLFIKSNNFEQLHAPDGENRGGADAGTSLAPTGDAGVKRRSAPLNGREMLHLAPVSPFLLEPL